MKSILLKIKEKLHRKFKIKVAQDGTNMQEKIIELITEYVEGE
jgi:predicted DNA binding CopG/RHH family protein